MLMPGNNIIRIPIIEIRSVTIIAVFLPNYKTVEAKQEAIIPDNGMIPAN